jgi:hypothetical protein
MERWLAIAIRLLPASRPDGTSGNGLPLTFFFH